MKNAWRKIALVCIVVSSLLLVLLWSFTGPLPWKQPKAWSLTDTPNPPPRQDTSVPRKAAESQSTKPTVLWVRPAGYVPVAAKRLATVCPQWTHCLTFNMSRLADVPVVVFDGHRASMPKTPPKRPRGQVWVFYSQEAPPAAAAATLGSPAWRSAFNWTVSYRLDADVWAPYGTVHSLDHPDRSLNHLDRLPKWNQTKWDADDGSSGQQPNLTSVMAAKRRGMAAWMVSHCRTHSRREDYVKELQKHFPVDIWGACNHRSCPRQHLDKCEGRVAREYKFYLAFENALCQDYVTEKFFMFLDHDTIPVVRGGAQYSRWAPPGTYIDSSQFAGPRQLGEFLKALDKDDARYEAMLRRQRRLRVEYEEFTYRLSSGGYHTHLHFLLKPLCELCEMAAEPEKHQKHYGNISDWFIGNKCWKPQDVPTST